MKAPEVWRAFHDAFAALPADFLAMVVMSCIHVNSSRVAITIQIERDGNVLELSRMEDMKCLENSSLPIADVAEITLNSMLHGFGHVVGFSAKFMPVPMPAFLKQSGGS